MRVQPTIALALVLALPETLFVQEGPVQLKYSYPNGRKVIYKNKANVDLSVGVPAQAMSEWSSAEQSVGTREDGSFGVSVVFSDVNESILVAGQLIRQEILKPLEGEVFQFDLTPDGNLINFVPPAVKKLPGRQREVVQTTIAALHSSYAGLFPELPKEPVQVGDSWTSKRVFKVDYEAMHTEGNTQLSSAYTIKAARKKDGYGCFEVEEKSQITSRAFYSFGDLSVITDGTGTVAGKWVFDYDRGLIHYYEARAKMDTQSIPVGGTNANPIASTLTATTKRELKAIE